MEVFVIVIVFVGREARYGVLRCHATTKMNFLHPENIYFAISKIAICAIFVTSCTILHIAGDKHHTCIRLLSEKYFSLSATPENHRFVFVKRAVRFLKKGC